MNNSSKLTLDTDHMSSTDSACLYESSNSNGDVEEPSTLATPSNSQPTQKNGQLSEVSKRFDRNGKGFLDDTEKALRRMDTENLGYLPVNKVYSLMESLQKEQKNSAGLLKALEVQQRQMITLKYGIIALCTFSVLLAISNIGTSFAAAKLAKEVTVSQATGDLNDLTTGQRVGVTSKFVNIDMQPVSSERRRRLQLEEIAYCNGPGRNKTAVSNCQMVGTLSYKDMVLFHQQFCQGWPGKPGCAGGGVDKVRLTCNGRISIIDNRGLDAGEPKNDPKDPFFPEFVIFPRPWEGYHGEHHVYPPNMDTWSGPPCKQEFQAGIMCNPNDDSEPCNVFAWQPAGTEACYSRYVELCGNTDDYLEGEEGR